MAKSKLKIPKICEQCGKPFEAKTVATRFCSPYCVDKSGRAKRRRAKEAIEKQTLLEESINKIAEIQNSPIYFGFRSYSSFWDIKRYYSSTY